jgi:hypothetical protein
MRTLKIILSFLSGPNAMTRIFLREKQEGQNHKNVRIEQRSERRQETTLLALKMEETATNQGR